MDKPLKSVTHGQCETRGPIYKISYVKTLKIIFKFIVRSTFDSDLKRAKISLGNIVS